MKARAFVFLLQLHSLFSLAQVDDKQLHDEQAGVADEISKFSASKIRLYLYALKPGQVIYFNAFYGVPILGSVEITLPEEKDELLKAFIKGVREGNGGAKCFIPRHALRVMSGSTTTDFVICYECGYVRSDSFPNGSTVFISHSPQAAFDKYADKYHLKHRWKFHSIIAVFVGVMAITAWSYREKLISRFIKST
jgi:hypothetical protein